MAVDSALTLAVSLTYSGVANDLDRTLVGQVDETMSRRRRAVALLPQSAFRDRLATELSEATSGTRAQMDMCTVYAAAHASISQAAPLRRTSPPLMHAPRGDTGGPSGGYIRHPSTPGLYRSPLREKITPPCEWGPSGSGCDEDLYHEGEVREGGRGWGTQSVENGVP